MATLFKKEKQQKKTFCWKGGMINAYSNNDAILTEHLFPLMLRVLGVENCDLHFSSPCKQ